MEDKALSSLESLEVINSMINKARNRFSENGHLYLVWGWTILFCSLAFFAIAYWKLYQHPQHVYSLTILAWAYTMYYVARQRRKERVRTYTDEIIGAVWGVFAVMLGLMGFMLSNDNYYKLIYPVTLALYGIPTFLSGVVFRFRPLIVGAVGCWVLAVVCTRVPLLYHVLLIALAVVVAWIVPGYLLRGKYKNSQ
jgi:hypothetical protein